MIQTGKNIQNVFYRYAIFVYQDKLMVLHAAFSTGVFEVTVNIFSFYAFHINFNNDTTVRAILLLSEKYSWLNHVVIMWFIAKLFHQIYATN